MKKFTSMVQRNTIKAMVASSRVKAKISSKLAQNTGEGFVDTALKILISVIIGSLLMAGLYMLFNETILPTLQTKIKELFNYKG